MVLGKVKSLTISFDCLNGSNILVYSSGDTVSGRVGLEVTGETRVKSLKIHARGYAKVRWTESRNAGSNTAYTQNYTEEVEYFNHKDVLLGHERDDDNSEAGLHTIHSGRHEYAFSFELPQIPLATSFEGRHGGVRYWVKAELHRPWLLPVKLKKEFTVFEHIDINTPSLLSPQAGTKEKTLCCWLCTSGPISLSAKIERKGYTPGESIQIFAEIENCSSRMVLPKATIYQTQAFYAKGKMKQVKQLVANLCGESLSAGKTETWNGKLLKIPPVSPSILDCSIIRVEYSLVVYVDIPGAMDLFLNLPLVIGTIPLHPFGSRTSSVSSQRSMNMNWLGLTLPERPEAPPSYAEVVTGENRHFSLAPIAAFDDFERVLQGPLFAYIQKFRFLPPPLYSENHGMLGIGRDLKRSSSPISLPEQERLNKAARECVQVEPAAYREDELPWETITFNNNEPILNLFWVKPLGLLSLLDEQSAFPQATDKMVWDKPNSSFKENLYFQTD